MTDWELAKSIVKVWKIRYKVLLAQCCSQVIQNELRRRHFVEEGKHLEAEKMSQANDEGRVILKFIQEMEQYIPDIGEVNEELKQLNEGNPPVGYDH